MITPIEFAKKIDKRPQVVYGWIRDQGMPHHIDESTGAKMVDEEEAMNWYLEREGKPRKQRNSEDTGHRSDLPREHTIVRYERLPKTGLQTIAAVDRALENLILLRKSNGHTVPFTHESLKERLKRGEIIVEDPETVLGFVINEYSARGEQEIANALQQICDQFGIIRKAHSA